MDALIKSVGDLFGGQHRYFVPEYQRPYVWEEGKQWQPLWEDVERVTDARLAGKDETHFLGAIVIRHEHAPPGGITEWSIIDGQQRLTTLQLLIAALAAAAREDERDKDARLLEKLLRHDEDEATGEKRFKFWPTSANRKAFRAVIEAGSEAGALPDDPDNNVHEAWTWFHSRARAYAHADAAEEEEVARRYVALREAVTGLCRLVTIGLEREDPAQVIFETLNARGTPLLAMDLVKNALFDAARGAGATVDEVHLEAWQEELGDHQYWGVDQRLGRETVNRAEAFLLNWVVMKLGEVAPPRPQLFEETRRKILPKNQSQAVEMIKELNADARVLRRFDSYESGTVERRFFDTLAKLDITTLHPVALLLFRHDGLEVERRGRALRALESYLVRRTLCGLTTQNYNNLAAQLVSRAQTDIERGDELVVQELLESQADTFRWPTDDELRAHLATRPLYGWLGRKKIVLVLSALERAGRDGKTEDLDLPAGLEVEHVMPRAWREHWPLSAEDDVEAARERGGKLDLLGNLTLVTKGLNASMSNAPWISKREALKEYSLLVLNRGVVTKDEWTETTILERTAALTETVLKLWPGPQEFVPHDWRQPGGESWPEYADLPLEAVTAVHSEGSANLRALLEWLAARPGERYRMSEIEAALGWPTGRLRNVRVSYETKVAKRYKGRRPWHLHLDEDGTWWMWLDAERAAVIAAPRQHSGTTSGSEHELATSANSEILHKGWTEPLLREALELASPRAQEILGYIAAHPGCTSEEIADSLGLVSARSVGPTLHQGFTRPVEDLEVSDDDGEFRWPLEFPGRRGGYELYDMDPRVRSVVLEVVSGA